MNGGPSQRGGSGRRSGAHIARSGSSAERSIASVALPTGCRTEASRRSINVGPPLPDERDSQRVPTFSRRSPAGIALPLGQLADGSSLQLRVPRESQRVVDLQ